jgi:hypothetical protein
MVGRVLARIARALGLGQRRDRLELTSERRWMMMDHRRDNYWMD